MALMAASTAVAAVGQLASGAYASAIAKRNAKVADMQSRDAILRGDQQADAQRMKTGALMAKQQVSIAASGVDIGSGSALDIIGDTALFGELDAKTIEQNAMRESFGYKNQAANFRAEGKAAKMSSYFNAAGTILAGATKVGTKFPNFFAPSSNEAYSPYG